jgi:tripartite-type tricarboxylate transporter receptor subunit TctC
MLGDGFSRSGMAPGRRSFLLGAVGLLAALDVKADAGFFAGETLRIILPNSAGSANDRVGRLLAEHLGRRLPATRIAVINETGANGRLAMLEVWEAEPDGLTVTIPTSNIIYSEILGDEGLPFSLRGFSWIGGLSQDRRIVVLGKKSKARDLDDILRGDRPLLLATDGQNSGTYVTALLLNAVLGCWLRPVTGYNASARALALLNGEADLLIGTTEAMMPQVEAGAGRAVLRLGDFALPAVRGAPPRLTDLPLAPDFAWIAEQLTLQAQVGRTLAAPPGMPTERLAAWRQLLTEVCLDPDFAAAAADTSLDLTCKPGQMVAETMQRLLHEREATAVRLRAALLCGQQRADSGTGC